MNGTANFNAQCKLEVTTSIWKLSEEYNTQGSYSSWDKKFKDFSRTVIMIFQATKIDGMQYIECVGCVNLSSK